MIMGANIGTTVTNTLVSLTHARQTEQFRAAFTAATMHDFFNVIVVIVLLPLEILTGFLSKTAALIAHVLVNEGVGGSFDSPIKAAVGWVASAIQDVVERVIANETVLSVVGIGLAIALIFFTVSFITKNMRLLVADRIERTLNAALARSGMVGIVVGALVTIAVQSSSITTSILIPLVASGLLLVRNAYPITLGANIGTTITALLAALAAGTVDSLTIAFTHTIFNIAGILLIFPWLKIRYVPVIMAEKLADIAIKRKSLALGYTFGVFVVIPALGILILR
jgi:sodium-dependent phosphate cotransporter